MHNERWYTDVAPERIEVLSVCVIEAIEPNVPRGVGDIVQNTPQIPIARVPEVCIIDMPARRGGVAKHTRYKRAQMNKCTSDAREEHGVHAIHRAQKHGCARSFRTVSEKKNRQ